MVKAPAYYELSTFTAGNPPEDRELFRQGKAYGLESLALNPRYEERKTRDFKGALSQATDPAALLWTADNWGDQNRRSCG